MRVPRTHEIGDVLAVAGDGELPLVHVLCGSPVGDVDGIAGDMADEAAEVFVLRRLAGAEHLRQRVLVGELVPVHVVAQPDGVDRIAHRLRDHDDGGWLSEWHVVSFEYER